MYNKFYFLGIGGIGMSAIARFYKSKGFPVAGYDKTPSKLTAELESEGIEIHFNDSDSNIPEQYKSPNDTLVIFTPAVPADSIELNYFKNNGFKIIKRAAALGDITKRNKGLCISGTHGKTTTSTIVAHLLKSSSVDCNAFLGGIAKNYTNNLLLSDKSDYVVIEADEYDRSFHHLSPYMAVITSTDPDHLDIYGTEEAYHESFSHFTSLIQPGGVLISKKGIYLNPRINKEVKHYTYSGSEQADFYATNIKIENSQIIFDCVTPKGVIADIELGVPVMINIENSVAAIAIALLNGVTSEEIKAGIKSFKGIRRRFDIHYKSDKLTVIDDYAHHPDEVAASVKSLKLLYKDKKVCGIFQPHLFSRTNDFYKEFAKALTDLDIVVLVEIYPARELPMEGVTSKLIFDNIDNTNKYLVTKEELKNLLPTLNFEVLATMGAGDIDTYIEQLINLLK